MIRPLGARALVKRMDAPKPESQLLFIPASVEDKPSVYALVLAIGTLKQGGFDVGDVVVLRDFAGAPAEVDMGDGELIEAAIVAEDDVLMVIEGA